MKLIPLFVMFFLASCEPVRNDRSVVQPFQKPEVQKPHVETDELRFTSVSNTHMSPKVKIDTDRQEIEVTGHSGSGCGIDFQEGQVLRYQFPDAKELELVMETETLKFKRVHRIKEENGIYGDWQYVDYIEEQANNRERIITLFIRENEIMNVDVYCEYGKYEH